MDPLAPHEIWDYVCAMLPLYCVISLRLVSRMFDDVCQSRFKRLALIKKVWSKWIHYTTFMKQIAVDKMHYTLLFNQQNAFEFMNISATGQLTASSENMRRGFDVSIWYRTGSVVAGQVKSVCINRTFDAVYALYVFGRNMEKLTLCVNGMVLWVKFFIKRPLRDVVFVLPAPILSGVLCYCEVTLHVGGSDASISKVYMKGMFHDTRTRAELFCLNMKGFEQHVHSKTLCYVRGTLAITNNFKSNIVEQS